jgi:hypothetical protein
MSRDIKEQSEVTLKTLGIKSGGIGLVQDRHDDPEQTDRWFVEGQLQFDTEAEARAFFGAVRSYLNPEKKIR